MDNVLNEIYRILEKYENMQSVFSEIDISQGISKVIRQTATTEPSTECLAEAMAFEFCENYQSKDTGWGTYYGPMMVFKDTNGSLVESPSIKKITPEVIEYWSERANEAKNPILRARYADLVWDFSKIVTGKQSSYTIAQIVIDAILEIARNDNYKYEIGVITKIERALSLALLINDVMRIELVRDCIIDFEDKIAEDDKPGTWGFSYNLLLNNKKVNLSDAQKQKIILDLEDRLKRVSEIGSANFNPWSTESAALYLANHYRRCKQNEDVKRVLKILGNVFENISKDSSPIQASTLLQRLCAIYLEYNLRDDADKITKILREIGPEINKEMKEISHEIKMPKEEIDRYIDNILEGDLEDVLSKIAVWNVPKKEQVEKQLRKLSEETPISFLCIKQLKDHQGRTVASIGPLDSDLEGNIIFQMAQNLRISSMILRMIMDSLLSKFNISANKLVDYLFKSPVFNVSKKEILQLGIQSYIDGSYINSVHLLIPQIEDAIRNLVEISGGSILKPSKNGGFNYKTLDELLREKVVIDALGDDVTLYFRVLLTDQRGWNLRNEVCHGIPPTNVFSAHVADRIIHVLLYLALLREEKS